MSEVCAKCGSKFGTKPKKIGESIVCSKCYYESFGLASELKGF